jgi:hypothetical protein
MRPSTQDQTSGSVWPYLALCALAAAWVDLGSVHRLHCGDSIVPVLTSLYRWTPFYWEQNRFGMLVPLLALPFRHPLANLLVQDGLTVFAGLAALFLLARYIVRAPTWPLVGTLGAAAFLALPPAKYRFDYLVTHPYGVSLALGLAALLLAEAPGAGALRRWRYLLALILSVLGHWVNPTISLVLGPLALIRPWLRPAGGRRAGGPGPEDSRAGDSTRAAPADAAAPTVREAGLAQAGRLAGRLWAAVLASEAAVALLVLGIGLAAAVVVMKRAPHPTTSLGGLPPARWPGMWAELARNTWTALAPHHWPSFLGLLILVGLLPLRTGAGRRQASGAVRTAAALGAVALAYGLFTGTREWMQIAGTRPRYVMYCALLLQTAALCLAAAPFRTLWRARAAKAWYAAAAVLLLAAAWRGYGMPSLAGVRADLDRQLGARTADVLAARCTHVLGRYNEVWPTVFHANLQLHERGAAGPVWGVAHRCQPTRPRWGTIPFSEMRVAVPLENAPDGPDVRWAMKTYGFPALAVVERRPTVWIMRPLGPIPEVGPPSLKPKSRKNSA